jgi:hypothetical protein
MSCYLVKHRDNFTFTFNFTLGFMLYKCIYLNGACTISLQTSQRFINSKFSSCTDFTAAFPVYISDRNPERPTVFWKLQRLGQDFGVSMDSQINEHLFQYIEGRNLI